MTRWVNCWIIKGENNVGRMSVFPYDNENEAKVMADIMNTRVADDSYTVHEGDLWAWEEDQS